MKRTGSGYGNGGMMARARQQNPPAPVPLLTQHSVPDAQSSHREAVCIGCGCSDGHACVTGFTLDSLSSGLQGCFWVKVDYKLGIGVCSECVERVEEFETRVIESRGKGQAASGKEGRRSA